MNKIILGFVGQIASGKDASKKYLAEKYGAESCRFSTVLRDVLTRIGVDITRENIQKISTALRQNFGEDLLANTITKDASNLQSDIVIVDGVRRMTDITHLQTLPHFFLVKIEASPEIRYERMKTRNENVGDVDKSFADFLKDHEAEADREIPIVMSNAKYSLDNNGSFEELYLQIDKLISILQEK
jgi:dephospho-CoA kinase